MKQSIPYLDTALKCVYHFKLKLQDLKISHTFFGSSVCLAAKFQFIDEQLK